MHRVDRWNELRTRIHPGAIFEATGASIPAEEGVEIDKIARFTLPLLDGQRDVEEIMEKLPFSRYAILEALWELVASGAARASDVTAAPNRQKRLDMSFSEALAEGQRGDWGKAVQILEGLSAMRPDFPGLAEEMTRARDRLKREIYETIHPTDVPVVAIGMDALQGLKLTPADGFVVSRISALGSARRRRRDRGMKTARVPPGGLPLVESPVGRSEKIVVGRGCDFRDDSDRDGDAKRRRFHSRIANALENPLRNALRRRRLGAGHQHDKFVSAPPRGHVVGPLFRFENSGDMAQRLAPDGVPPLIVDRLESVDVDEEERERLSEAKRTPDRAPVPLLERTLVGEPRQLVVDRQLTELLLGGGEPVGAAPGDEARDPEDEATSDELVHIVEEVRPDLCSRAHGSSREANQERAERGAGPRCDADKRVEDPVAHGSSFSSTRLHFERCACSIRTG